MFSRKPTTVDAAIAPLLKAVADLEGVAGACNVRSSLNRAEVERLEDAITADQTELTRAEAIATKIKAITEG